MLKICSEDFTSYSFGMFCLWLHHISGQRAIELVSEETRASHLVEGQAIGIALSVSSCDVKNHFGWYTDRAPAHKVLWKCQLRETIIP